MIGKFLMAASSRGILAGGFGALSRDAARNLNPTSSKPLKCNR